MAMPGKAGMPLFRRAGERPDRAPAEARYPVPLPPPGIPLERP